MLSSDELSLPLSMNDFDDSPILLANHFLIQHQPDEFVLSLSQVTGPPLVGTPDEIREDAAAGGRVDRAPPGARRRARPADGRSLTCTPVRC
jgi:hypothetical protein